MRTRRGRKDVAFDLENTPNAKLSRLRKRKAMILDSDSDDENQDFCQKCRKGGKLLLCDSCPKAYHLKCLDASPEEIPGGDWSCPRCEGIDSSESDQSENSEDNYSGQSDCNVTASKTKSGKNVFSDHSDFSVSDSQSEDSENDDNVEFCTVCKEGGRLLCCDSCPNSFHLKCCQPKLLKVPKGDWKCHFCTIVPLPGAVQKIISWRWNEKENRKDISDLEDVPLATSEPIDKREFLVKWKDRSYWHCSWVTGEQLDMFHRQPYKAYLRKNDMDEPPVFDTDGDENADEFEKSFDRGLKHHPKRPSSEAPNLHQRFFRYGIRPEFLQIQRVVAKKVVEDSIQYLIKWKDLPYIDGTWEDEDSTIIPDLQKFIEAYKNQKENFATLNNNSSGKKRRLSKPRKNLNEKYEEQPAWIPAGLTLHSYQLEGLNWARHSWSSGTDIILADEMGLGKTIQTIIFLYSPYKEGHSNGPFLISVPLSTLINWERELELWAPDFQVVSYVGDKDSRAIIREFELSYEDHPGRQGKRVSKIKSSTLKFHVLLTSYELVALDAACLGSISWNILVVDEAHRLKNASSRFFQTLSGYQIKFKLLLTGTPLQNNLQELFYLLNFLTPAKFNDLESFQSNFADITKEEQVHKLHDMLGSRMLCRMKSDVLKSMPPKAILIVRTNLAPLQKTLYRHILTRNYSALTTRNGSQKSLSNIMMQLKKVANHPYLFPAASEEAPVSNGIFEIQALTKGCGKLVLLWKMLQKLKEQGHRVLIFSQMTMMLDLLEDFLDGEGYLYERIDGSIMGTDRQDAIDRFNKEGAKQFVFLLSTRAGGLGINLYTADTVIIYDSDWNPHNDIQAFSRAHRLGQKNKVMVYQFVTKNTVEERVAQVAKKKMMLTHLVVQTGSKASLSKKEIDDIISSLGKGKRERREVNYCVETKKELNTSNYSDEEQNASVISEDDSDSSSDDQVNTFDVRLPISESQAAPLGLLPVCCIVCERDDLTEKSCHAHWKRQHVPPDKKYSCPECGKKFTRPYTVIQHRKKHLSKDFICSFCGKRFYKQDVLNVHVFEKHSCPGGKKKKQIIRNSENENRIEGPLKKDGEKIKISQMSGFHIQETTKQEMTGNKEEAEEVKMKNVNQRKETKKRLNPIITMELKKS